MFSWKKVFSYLVALPLLVLTVPAFAEMKLNMPEGVTPVSKDIYALHMTIFWICVLIGVVVFGVLTYSLIHHRKSKGAVSAKFHEHTWVEIIWALIPFLILIGMAIPATRVLMDMYDFSKDDVTIKVTGHQWRWHYDYLDYGISYFSDLSTPQSQIENLEKKSPEYLLEVNHPLVVPIHRKIRFLVTSGDVIHSWWVPDLGVKRDAIPGFIHEAWARIDEPGTYRGQCAELCGLRHAFMPIVVEAVTPEAFQTWLEKEKTSALAKKKEAS